MIIPFGLKYTTRWFIHTKVPKCWGVHFHTHACFIIVQYFLL